MNNLLLLDLDGTVRRTRSGETFINTPEDQEIIPEAAATLNRWVAGGAYPVACSNQAGVHAGYKTIGQCIDEMLWTMKLAPAIQCVFFSPDSDGQRCFTVSADGSVQTFFPRTFPGLSIRSFRKPASGMLVVAAARFDAEIADCVFVGDRDEDRSAALSCGMDFLPADVWWASEPQTVEGRR